jgi:hypothetical protein
MRSERRHRPYRWAPRSTDQKVCLAHGWSAEGRPEYSDVGIPEGVLGCAVRARLLSQADRCSQDLSSVPIHPAFTDGPK